MATGKRWAIPDDWNPESGEYRLAVFCIPDSQKWRGLIRAHINHLTYGRAWDEKTGSILDVLEIAREIDESFDMNCGEDLKRIADTLDNWYDRQYISIFDLQSALTDAGLEPLAKVLDTLDEVIDIFNLLPALPDIRLPMHEILRMVTYNITVSNALLRWDNTNQILQAQTIGQVGPSVATLLPALINLIPGYNMADILLGNNDDDVQVAVAALIETLLGNYMTNRTKDIADAVSGLDFGDSSAVVSALKEISQKCEMCGAVGGGCGCPPYGTVPGEVIDQPDPETEPPPSGFADWEDYFVYKCAASNRIVDDYIATLTAVSRLFSAVLAAFNQQVQTEIIGSALGSWAAVGVMKIGYNTAINGAKVVEALVNLLIADAAYYERIDEMLALMAADKETIVCDLFQAITNGQANTSMADWQSSFYAGLTYSGPQTQAAFTTQMNVVRANLVSFPVRNVLFSYHAETASYTGAVDCDDCGSDAWEYIVIDGLEAGSGSLTTSDISWRTLTAVEFPDGVYRLQIKVSSFSRNGRLEIFDADDASVSTWPTCRLRCQPGQEVIWIHDTQGDDFGPKAEAEEVYIGGDLKINGDGPFSVDIYLYTDFHDSADCGSSA